MLRNIGASFSYCQIAYDSLNKGLNKIVINKEVINNDLNNRWELLSEPIQTILRMYSLLFLYIIFIIFVLFLYFLY